MKNLLIIAAVALAASCTTPKNKFTGAPGEVKLITLDPGHFHAALVQKSMYPQISPEVAVYAPQGADVQMHLDRINGYNSRTENPTNWSENVYTGQDFFQKMVDDKAGNVVVIASNNGKKSDYIKGAILAGLNVLSDKPMAIDQENYKKLIEAFDASQQNGTLLYDIMTERYEITNTIQKELAAMSEFIGQIETGTPENPAIIKESIHHIAKDVSGVPLIRPEWYFDVTQQGEGIVDVTTHLVDLVQWCVVGEQPIDIEKQIEITSATRRPTYMSLQEYKDVTGKDSYPEFLIKDVKNDTLSLFSNGEINYKINGINTRVIVQWNYRAPKGGGDTHFAVIKGTKADVIIEQGAKQGYKPMLYVSDKGGDKVAFEKSLLAAVDKINTKYPGMSVTQDGQRWQITIPAEYYVGHEAHFAQVMEKYLKFLVDGKIPQWEIANMKAKYFTTTKGLEIAKQK